jgi:hypothetical protein
MRKKYKNGFYSVVQKAGLRVEDFIIEEKPSDDADDLFIHFRNTPLYFRARQFVDSEQFICEYTKFWPTYPCSELYPEDGFVTIRGIYSIFEKWLKSHVKQYLDELLVPDLWEQAASQGPLVTSSELSDEDISQFSGEEKIQLRLALSEFRLLIAETFKPTQDQMHIIENRFNYLSDALDRLNRFDWKSILISSVLTISVALSLDTQRGKQLFDLLKRVFSNVIHLLQ